jgi:cell division protein FtsW
MRAGSGLILVVAALLCLGVVMVTSAGLQVATGRTLSTTDVLSGRPALLAAAAFVALLVGARVPLDRLLRERRRIAPALVAAGGILILLASVHVPGIGREVNGARRWIEVGPVSFQPSEVAKWVVVVILAWYGARSAPRMENLRAALPPVAWLAAVCGLIATEDLGTAILIGAVGECMLLAAGMRLRHAAPCLPVAAAGLAAALAGSPYRLERLRSFLHPFDDPQGGGYQLVQSLVAVHGGGLAGRGLGNGVQKLGYLPEDTTDFIFAVICEELGLMGAVAVVGLYAALLLCGGCIVCRVRDPLGRLLGTGILLTVGAQALLNIAVVTGAVPTKGIALPLVSLGGTGWVTTSFCVGLLLSIERRGAPDRTVPRALRVRAPMALEAGR